MALKLSPTEVHNLKSRRMNARLTPGQIKHAVGFILEVVAYSYGLKPSELIGKSHRESLYLPKQVAAYLSRKLCQCSRAETAQAIGYSCHKSAQNAAGAVQDRMDTQPAFRRQMEWLLEFVGRKLRKEMGA